MMAAVAPPSAMHGHYYTSFCRVLASRLSIGTAKKYSTL